MIIVDLSSKKISDQDMAANHIDQILTNCIELQVKTIERLYRAIWENESAMPQQVFAAFGGKAKKMWRLYQEQISSLDKSISLLNVTRSEISDAKYFTTPSPVTTNGDGTVTVG